nr:MAG TPA: hypothetical protein [Caudoviricetes sp.]
MNEYFNITWIKYQSEIRFDRFLYQVHYNSIYLKYTRIQKRKYSLLLIRE